MNRTVPFGIACLLTAASVALASRAATPPAPGGAPATPAATPSDDPLAPWRQGVTIRPVAPPAQRHTLHAYYLASPESPDGTRALYFSSTDPAAHKGDVCIVDRATGSETVLARNVEAEDAHRGACQQWTSAGKRVAFHDVRQGKWGVYVIDLDTGRERAVAPGRQLCFGAPTGDLLPVYGPHWNPGEHRGLELADAATGEVRKVFDIDAVTRAYGPWLQKQFAGKPVSVFFPHLSPDQKRVFFKMAAGAGGDNFRAKGASQREGLIAYDLAEDRFLYMRERWGHPAWCPDSRHIIEVGNLLFDSADKGKMTRIPDLPKPGGCHLAVSPDGKLFVQDGLIDKIGGKPGEWGIVLCDIRGGEGRYQILHRFDNSRGAKSWRRNHPHPVFSADGKRIYFNTNDTAWTTLHVAECAPAKP